MSNTKNNKTFELETCAYYPVKIRIKASSKSEAIKMLENKDNWELAEQEHDIANWNFDTWYVENIKEVIKPVRKKKQAFNKSELHNVYKDKEGLAG